MQMRHLGNLKITIRFISLGFPARSGVWRLRRLADRGIQNRKKTTADQHRKNREMLDKIERENNIIKLP